MVQIRFIKQGSNSVLGGFASGDVARVSEEFAAHLVNEARVAVYLDAPAVKPEQQAPKPNRRNRSRS